MEFEELFLELQVDVGRVREAISGMAKPEIDAHRSGDGACLIHLAAGLGDVSTTRLLLSKGADPNCRDTKGLTPLHYCASSNKLMPAQLLIDHGADPCVRDNHGNTSLWTSLLNLKGSYEMLSLLAKHVNYDCVVSCNKHGVSPLQFAIRINDQSVLSILNSVPR